MEAEAVGDNDWALRVRAVIYPLKDERRRKGRKEKRGEKGARGMEERRDQQKNERKK